MRLTSHKDIYLESERLYLRRFVLADWRDLYEYLSDEKVVRYEPYGVFTEQQAYEEAHNRANDEAFLAVCLKENDKMIGNLYFPYRQYNSYELGFIFATAYQKQGYAAEASARLLDYAFGDEGAHRVFAMCNPENTDSWHLMERLHMRREAHYRQNVYFAVDENGLPIWQDTYVYGVLAEEWLKASTD